MCVCISCPSLSVLGTSRKEHSMAKYTLSFMFCYRIALAMERVRVVNTGLFGTVTLTAADWR